MVDQLAAFGENNVRRALPGLLQRGAVEFLAGDAQSEEIMSRGPFQAIHVSTSRRGVGLVGGCWEASSPQCSVEREGGCCCCCCS